MRLKVKKIEKQTNGIIKKIIKGMATGFAICMCFGTMTVFADYYSNVLTKGTNFALASSGESLNHFATNTDIKYLERVGANYSWKSITDYKKSSSYNYVRTTVKYKNKAGNWKKLAEIDMNMPSTGRIFCPRYTYSDIPTRVWGVKYFASNKFDSDETGYGKTAKCETSLVQGYLYCD